MSVSLIALVTRLLLLLACGVFACGLVLLARNYPVPVVLVLLAIAWCRLRGGEGSNWSHGTATITSSVSELGRKGLLSHDGLILGRCLPEKPSKLQAVRGLCSPFQNSESACRAFLAAFFGKSWLSDRFIRMRAYVHLATYAPAGAGKGTGVLVPNLLSFPGNCVVTDPKGELYKLTSAHRQVAFGHRIVRIDPFGVCGSGSDTLNPFDFLDAKSDSFLDDCRDLSNMMVVRTGQEKDPFFDDSAELTLTSFTAFVCGCEAKPERRNLATVRGLTSSRGRFAAAVEFMQQTTACHGVIQRQGGLLTWFSGETLDSVLSTFQRHTAFLDSLVVARSVASSSFDPMILRKGKATVYLILPADKLVSLAPLQRMWIGTIMRVITRGAPTETNPVLWFLDEMAHIGRMPAIQDAVTLMRGMGMRLWFFFQSVEQLKTCFGDHAATILDNIGTHQYFGVQSQETAEAISKRIGEATISTRSVNTSTQISYPADGMSTQGQQGSRSVSRSVNRSDMARRLMKPEEILTLPNKMALIFHKNVPVVQAWLAEYYNSPEFARGGSGRQKRLGVSAGIMGLFTCTVALLFVEVAASLPPPQAFQRPPVVRYPQQMPAYRPPLPFQPPMARPVQRRIPLGSPYHQPKRSGVSRSVPPL